MKIDLKCALLLMVCVALCCAWYVERCRFLSADSAWNSERKRLVHAGILLGENNISFDLEDNIAELSVVPEMGDLPGVTRKGLELHWTSNALKNLILLVNIEKDLRKILFLETKSERTVDSHYYNIAYEIWGRGEKPTFADLEKFARSRGSIEIQRPNKLKALIEKISTDRGTPGLFPHTPIPNGQNTALPNGKD